MNHSSLKIRAEPGSSQFAPAQPPHGYEAGTSSADSALSGLVLLAQAGDRLACERLLSEARPRAFAVAMKVLRNPVDAEDAVQIALLKIWKSLPQFEARSSFYTWLHRIVLNASLDLLRHTRVRGTDAAEGPGADEDAPPAREARYEETPERTLARQQAAKLVRAAVQRLSPMHRETLCLREFEDSSYEEIAAQVSCPIGTVMSRLHHARRGLAKELTLRLGHEVEVLCAA